MATEFEKVQRGLRDDIVNRNAASVAEKQRWKEAIEALPKEVHPLAIKLLSAQHKGRCLSAKEVIRACEVAQGKQSDLNAQTLFEQGIAEAARLTGMPMPEHVGRALPSAPKTIKLDPALYEAGAKTAKALLAKRAA